MGKGTKRKNAGVGVDFRKVKHKVGKKLPKAQNETRTDFQSRSINLPNQSVTQDKAGAAVSERNLTLKELVSQLSHHNSNTRRDALVGLQQLLAAHPAEGRRHAALLLEALATRISDGEQPVRTALLTLLRASALPAIGPACLAPFLPLFLAHLSAGLTHLSADVRLDALAVLEALTEAAPGQLAADDNLLAVLRHYTGLLSRANRGKSVKSQALAGLLKILGSLQRFLAAALAAAAAAAAGSGGNGGDNGASAGTSSEQVLMACRAAPAPPAAAKLPAAADLLRLYCCSSGSSSTGSDAPAVQQQPSPAAAAAAAGSSGGGSSDAAAVASAAAQLQAQALALLAALFDCWGEAAPASLSLAPEYESAQVLVHILSCSQLLVQHLSPAATPATAAGATFLSLSSGSDSGSKCPGFSVREDKTLWLNQAPAVALPRLLKAFPVVAPSMTVSSQLGELLQRFNLLSVQLQAQFMAGGVCWPQQQQDSQQQAAPKALQHHGGVRWPGGKAAAAAVAAHGDWRQQLLGFMSEVLATGSCLPASALSSVQQQQQSSVPAAAGNSGKAGKQQKAAAAAAAAASQQQEGTGAAAAAAAAASSSNSNSVLLTTLQCLQQLLPHLPHLPRQQLMPAVKQLAVGSSGSRGASQAVRTACLQLQLQLLQRYLLDAVPDAEQEQELAAWLATAPKQLWQLGPSRPAVTEILLQQLYQAGRLALPGGLMQQQLVQQQQQLAPLLATLLPPPLAAAARQPSKQQQQQQAVLVGPLAALPEQCQAVAFDLITFQPQLQQPLARAVAVACKITSYSDVAVTRLLEGVLAAAGSSMEPDLYLSFVATLLSPVAAAPPAAAGFVDKATSKDITAGFARHQLLADVVFRSLHCFGPLQQLLPLLAPLLLQQWQGAAAAGSSSNGTARALRCCSYSCLSLAALAAGVWQPSSRHNSTSGSSKTGSSSGSDTATPAAADAVPAELLQVLPQVCAAYCSSSMVAAHAEAAAAAAVGSGAAVAAANGCMPAVLPLLAALPQQLLLPFLQCFVGGCCAAQAGTGAAAAVDTDTLEAGVAAAAHVLLLLVGCQELKLWLVSNEQQLMALLQQLESAAQQVQQASGQDTAAATGVAGLRAAVAVLCGH